VEVSGLVSEKRLLATVPSLQKLEGIARTARLLHRAGPFIRPFGKIGRRIAQVIQEGGLNDVAKKAAEFATLPDRFNDHFLARGWIAYELMNGDALAEAVRFAESGDIESGERALVAAHSPQRIETLLIFTRGIEAFWIRREVFELALEDYKAGRFHAVVPVLLAQIDGIVADLSGHAFFATGRSVTAWDSISAHELGLQKLADILSVSRTSTNSDAITMPFRHGVMHGRDLGYANEMVAAKSWAVLFCLQAWAIAKRDGKTAAPTMETKPRSLWKSLIALAKQGELQRGIETWKPRTNIGGLGAHATEDPGDYPANSPERAVIEFFHWWKAKNYGKLVSFVPPRQRSGKDNQEAGRLRKALQGFHLRAFRVTNVDEHAVGGVVTANLELGSPPREVVVKVRVLSEDDTGAIGLRDSPGFVWRIYDDFLVRLANVVSEQGLHSGR